MNLQRKQIFLNRRIVRYPEFKVFKATRWGNNGKPMQANYLMVTGFASHSGQVMKVRENAMLFLNQFDEIKI